ncbi:MAG: RnfH family protein [Ideonella sp. MAG2]|nr:MAG: RnfH family protein [Ideonella sp. MAG2]
MAHAELGGLIDVLVCFSPQPRVVDEVALRLPQGSTVAQALEASGLLARYSLQSQEPVTVGVWMKLKPLETVLRQDDRVEIYRPLKVDPKEARRQRFRKQSAKSAG